MSENLTNEECAREKRFCFNIVIWAKSFLCTLMVFAIFCLRAEHTHVFFIHGANHLVHNEWADYPNSCWTANWYKLFSLNDSRSKLTWRGRFENVASLVVNFYSSGDEVLEIYERAHNPAWYNGFSPSGNWGERYSWHKQELYKGRKWWLGFIGTTYWSGWGFKENALGFKVWSAEDANAVTDVSIFKTNMVFNPYPISITNSVQSRVEIDSHLAQGIPSLSPPAGRIDLSHIGIQSFDMNSSVFMSIPYARSGNGDLDNRFLHSDIKNVAYMFNYKVFMKIVDVGGLR